MGLVNKQLLTLGYATPPSLTSSLSVSAVERMPPELWAEIFEQSVFCPSGLVEIRSDALPLRLRQICRSWKQTADSTPSLWTTMVVSNSNIHSKGLRAIKAWLKRSGSLGLKVTINPSNAAQHMIDNVVAVIVPYLERLVSISLPATLATRVLCSDAQIPCLQALALHMPMPVQLVLPSSAIRLRNVTLMLGSPFPDPSGPPPAVLNPVHICLPWEQLTQLTLRCFTGSVDTLHDVLLYCPRLVFLSLDGFCISPSIRRHRLHHSALRSLHLQTESDPSFVLDSFILSGLDTVHIDVMSPLAAAFSLDLRLQIVVLAWLSGFRTLILCGLFITEHDLVQLALISPSIRHMSIHYNGENLVTEPVRGMLMRTLDLSYFRSLRVGTSSSP
jgi:hypothetical protein